MAVPLRYNIRNLLARRMSTLMTMGGIALVVGIFTLMMAMVGGLRQAIVSTASPDNLVVVRKGSTTETNSTISIEQYNAIRFLNGIRRDAAGEPLASPELAMQVFLQRIGGASDNIVVRGVLPVAAEVHNGVKLIAGRMFHPGLKEVVVGANLAQRYRNCQLGSTLRFGRDQWKVVGIFTARGSSFESEIWSDLHELIADSRRGDYYSSVRLRTSGGAQRRALISRIEHDPQISLHAETETDYYAEQSVAANQLAAIGMVVALIMAIGAVSGAMNTMYTAVAARVPEIGTLRALGFSSASILSSFLFEAMILALAGGIAGVALALPINGFTSNFTNFFSYSTLSFKFQVTARTVIEAILFAAVMGALGGFLPARQAIRMRLVESFRRT
ncbi:MAG: ABC transporter permease [Candidatus Binataceae bacterium]